jgi:inorganic triphosphatase YgiF
MAYSNREREELEHLLDKMTVKGLFEALAQIAGEKEDHVLEAWQDRNLARRWARLSSKFDQLAEKTDDPYYQE